MAEYQIECCDNKYQPITPCGDIILCLGTEWVDRTVSGLSTVCATVDSIQTIGSNRINLFNTRCETSACDDIVKYVLTIDDDQFLEDPDNAPDKFRAGCDDIVDYFPYKCTYNQLLTQGGANADWVVDQDNVTQTVDVPNQIFDVFFPIIDRISNTPQGSFSLDLSALYTGAAPASINEIGDVDTMTTPPDPGDYLAWDGANWVPIDPFSFTVNAGTTPAVGDDSLGSEVIDSGDIIHFYSADASVNFAVSPGSAVVNIELSAALQAQIASNTAQIVANSAQIAINTANIATNTGNIATNTAQIAINTANITTNTGNISLNAADIANNTSDIATNASNIAANTAQIAINTGNIATNTANIATNAANIAANTAAIALKIDATDFIGSEIPAGIIDGVNANFTLANTPVVGTQTVYQNGLALCPGTEYSIVGTTLTLTAAPLTGDTLMISYIQT